MLLSRKKYRKYVPNFAEIALPLNKLTCKSAIYNWTKECQKSFETLKNYPISPLVLDCPNFSDNKEFILQCVVSDTAVGALLSKKNNRSIVFTSKCCDSFFQNSPEK